MSFDIHQDLYREGELDEQDAERYEQELLERFANSPEGQELHDEGFEVGWAGLMIQYGLIYFSVSPATMGANEFRQVLFSSFPRKVSCSPDEAPELVSELRAFWRFVGREFNLPNAAACLEVLDARAEEKLRRELGNPANFGIAKSFVMGGQAAGFDVHTEEGLTAWMLAYNASLNRSGAPPPSFPAKVSSLGSAAQARSAANRRKRERRKARRKR